MMLTASFGFPLQTSAEPVPPHASRLVADVDAAHMEQVLDLPRR
jgi:hypothetical protein